LTIDIDALDPSLIPQTGTPEPGGLNWYDVTNFIRMLMQHKRVVGLDLVELSPQEGHHAADFIAAKLIYKCIGYIASA
nr:agmatinase [candidate division Zixibacteria bacterium]NIR95533.1 agmatinase [Gammaproteobacteria bacterium]NIR64821.1 agmatinase [candidate division Zixibacteria bacterium]NIS46642.1 agmatinase [candidate division Zixibacteria bacterium]NIT53764.1 agmatinase [candidate division Zixibacteria bacterium]